MRSVFIEERPVRDSYNIWVFHFPFYLLWIPKTKSQPWYLSWHLIFRYVRKGSWFKLAAVLCLVHEEFSVHIPIYIVCLEPFFLLFWVTLDILHYNPNCVWRMFRELWMSHSPSCPFSTNRKQVLELFPFRTLWTNCSSRTNSPPVQDAPSIE